MTYAPEVKNGKDKPNIRIISPPAHLKSKTSFHLTNQSSSKPPDFVKHKLQQKPKYSKQPRKKMKTRIFQKNNNLEIRNVLINLKKKKKKKLCFFPLDLPEIQTSRPLHRLPRISWAPSCSPRHRSGLHQETTF